MNDYTPGEPTSDEKRSMPTDGDARPLPNQNLNDTGSCESHESVGHTNGKPRKPPKPWAEILTQQQMQMLDQFGEVRIRHKKMDDVIHELVPLLIGGSQSSLIFITGATGVGKTTLAKAIEEVCKETFERWMSEDRNAVPLVWHEARADGDHKHSFRPIYEGLLKQLKLPVKMGSAPAQQSGDHKAVAPHSARTLFGMRDKLVTGLVLRKTRWGVLDEAAQLGRIASAAAVLDVLRGLTNETGTKFLLIGAFDIFDLITESGQAARRTQVLLFERYKLDSKEDRVEWARIVKQFQAKWPLEQVPNFASISDELFEACLGCVGLLAAFLYEALAEQMNNKGEWLASFLAKAVKSVGLRDVIQREIAAGEARVTNAVRGKSLWDEAALKKLDEKMKAGGKK